MPSEQRAVVGIMGRQQPLRNQAISHMRLCKSTILLSYKSEFDDIWLRVCSGIFTYMYRHGTITKD